jgi:hypothetical protein
LVDGAELSRNRLSLPLRIKSDTEDGHALIAKELKNGQRSLRRFISSLIVSTTIFGVTSHFGHFPVIEVAPGLGMLWTTSSG